MDKSIRHASHHILQSYSNGGLHFVRRLVSESMLHQLGELLQEKLPSEEAELKEVWFRISPCLNHFANVLHSMSTSQRQKWASLLVEVLRAMLPAPSGVHKTILAAVLLLWQAEKDPLRKFPEENRQLVALAKSSRLQGRSEFSKLVAC